VFIAAIVTIAAASTLASCSGGSSGAVRSEPTAPATTGATELPRWDVEISALTHNVGGLPATLSGSDPETNTRLIGPKLNAFDLVLLQETRKTPARNPFAPMRVYDEILGAQSTHRYQSPMPPQPFGSDPVRSTALLADRLAFFSNLPMGDVTRTPWTDCFDGPDTSDHGAAACLAVKGFASTTITVADGARIDVYNLHGEAGSNSKDQELQAADYVSSPTTSPPAPRAVRSSWAAIPTCMSKPTRSILWTPRTRRSGQPSWPTPGSTTRDPRRAATTRPGPTGSPTSAVPVWTSAW